MDADAVIEKILPYAVIASVASFAAVIYFLGSSLALDVIMVLAGIVAGVIVSYFIYHSISQERTLEFMRGEEIILKSDSKRSYAMVMSIGDSDYPLDPVNSNIYLTNLGILAEPKGSGEAGIFVPLDKVTEFAPHLKGIRVRYVDVNLQFSEVLFFVEERSQWIQELARLLNAKAY